MRNSKVLKITHFRNKGEARILSVAFENGDSGEYFDAKGYLPFVEGDRISYELTPSRYANQPPHIKVLDDQIPAPFEAAPGPRRGRDEAMISAVAIVKSALEGGSISIAEAPQHIRELHEFFNNFTPVNHGTNQENSQPGGAPRYT